MNTNKAVKKARNIAEYEARNQRLRERQTLANELKRQYGYTGSPDQIIAKHEGAKLEAKRQAERAEAAEKARKANEAKQAQLASENNFVQESLAGPSGKFLVNWLRGRDATFARVKRFFDERPELERVEVKKAA